MTLNNLLKTYKGDCSLLVRKIIIVKDEYEFSITDLEKYDYQVKEWFIEQNGKIYIICDN